MRDREATEGERIRYSPSIPPRYPRRWKSIEVLFPVLDLKGISSGDFHYRESLELRRLLVRTFPDQPRYQQDLAFPEARLREITGVDNISH